MKTRVAIYQNIRNRHKYIEVHFDGYGHRTVRQFMAWDNGVKNMLGDTFLHRWRKPNFTELIYDYTLCGKQ
jgi:hypothetical protein